MNRKLIPVVTIVVALALGACGSDADMTTAATGSPDTSSTTVPQTAGANADDGELEPGKDGPVERVRRLWIKPDLVDCVGEAPQRCMQVAEAEDGQYNYFYDQIDGFTFQEGISYVLDVRVDEIDDPPADAGTLRYTLITIVEP